MKKTEETKATEKYAGGKIGHRSWIKAMEKLTFNEPIYAALWRNDNDEMSELISHPEWQSDWSIEKWADDWKFPLPYSPILHWTSQPTALTICSRGYYSLGKTTDMSKIWIFVIYIVISATLLKRG